MIFRKLREKQYIKKNIKKDIGVIIAEIEKIHDSSDIIAICPQPTGNNWRGVHSATIGLFQKNTFVIPQYYSKPVYSKQELNFLSEKILEYGFNKIILSGYPSYFKNIILSLNTYKKKENLKADIYIIYHGSLASNAEDDTTSKLLKDILELNKAGLVKKIGFVKKGMKETFSKISAIQSHYLMPMTKIIKNIGVSEKINSEDLNIGVFTHDLYRKNIHNQVAAALMFEKAKVHIKKNYEFDYLFSNNRFIIHGYFESYDDFLKLSSSMTINFYVSFSECFGLVISESLSMGVPCLAAYNSGIFDYDEELKKMLVVEDFDNSAAIYQQAKTVLENRDKISELGKEYIIKLNKIAEEKLKSFLSD